MKEPLYIFDGEGTTIIEVWGIGTPHILLYVLAHARFLSTLTIAILAMTDYTDYRIPILLAIPICFTILWTVVDHTSLSRAGQGGYHMPDIEKTVNPDSSPYSEALLSVFQLREIPVNSADSDLLQTISGIGPKLAERIIFERERSGSFASADDLSRVRGIGPKRISQFQESLRFD